MAYYDISCPVCGFTNDLNFDYCHNKSCLSPSAPFIVRRTTMKIELETLEENYVNAQQKLKQADKEKNGQAFELLINNQGKAILNLPLDFFFEWFLGGNKPLYSYRKLIALGLRERAIFIHDQKRSTVESNIFGTRDDLIYAALSVDEKGLHSYGPIALILNNAFVEKRAGMLIENSFTFTNKLKSSGWIDDDPIPPGNLSLWSARSKLALTKQYEKVAENDDFITYPKLVMHTSGERKTDDFMEVYVEGDVYPDAVDKVMFPADMVREFETNPAKIAYLYQLEEVKRKVNVGEYQIS